MFFDEEIRIVENPVEIDEDQLRHMAREVKSGIRRIYLHWTAGHYGQVYDHYHLSIDRNGQIYVTCNTLMDIKDHTWQRNHGAIGIALCCGVNADCWNPTRLAAWDVDTAYEAPHKPQPDAALVDFGPEPPTSDQVEAMARIVAILCDELYLPIDEDTVMTHCEAAFQDGYGPGDDDPEMRWDLWFLPDVALHGELYPGGDLIRGKAIFYQCEMAEEKAAK